MNVPISKSTIAIIFVQSTRPSNSSFIILGLNLPITNANKHTNKMFKDFNDVINDIGPISVAYETKRKAIRANDSDSSTSFRFLKIL